MLRHTITACWIAVFLALACGCSQRSRPLDDAPAEPPHLSVNQQPPATQPAVKAKVIAKWVLNLGAGRFDPVENVPANLKPVPLVLVMDDGRVAVSQLMFIDPMLHETTLIEGRLAPEQLEHFKNNLSNMTDGLGGQDLRGVMAVHSPYHHFVIDLPRRRTWLRSSFRLFETEGRPQPVLRWIPRREGWNQDPNLSRFQKLSQNYDPAQMAIRETFIAVEAEFLRAAAQAMINRALDEGQGRGE